MFAFGKVTRRHFVKRILSSGTIALTPVLKSWGASGVGVPKRSRGAQRTLSLNRDWIFEGRIDRSSGESSGHESASVSVNLPHCVVPLSWQHWDPSTWQHAWGYLHVFEVPAELEGLRLFLHFDRVMTRASSALNGHILPDHLGGFLPFEYEVTGLTNQGNNLLTVTVDSTWSNIPPAGSPKGPASVDYMLPGGISGSIELRGVPLVFVKDVFAKPVDVLSVNRLLEITASIDCGVKLPTPIRLIASLREGDRNVASTSKDITLTKTVQEVGLSLDKLTDVRLWGVDSPHLYDLEVTLFVGDSALHTYRTRVGFRDARFEVDGFFLNGKRLQLFGLDRHELYPYVGFSAPNRALQHDARYLRESLNCNIVRCSHYPQSEAFLNACDELGLMVWEEIPGWQYLGDESWKDLAVQNTADMIRRDRNHPSIIIWGTRVNESANDVSLYRRTHQAAKALDDSRPTSGSMTPSSRKDWEDNWHEDVFAFDDYHAAPDGSVGIDEPLRGVPYMLAEAVGQFSYGTTKTFSRKYRRAGDTAEQAQQAVLHAQAHSRAGAYARCAGVIAWCAFDYASPMNSYAGVKCPGIADTFRLPKLGASFYLAQVEPSVRPVIEPSFYWDFGLHSPSGPGKHAAIFSNCDRLDIFIDNKIHAVLHPDTVNYPNLKYPPFFVDLDIDGSGGPELRIDGYVNQSRLLSRSFSSNTNDDELWLHAEDSEIEPDGSDATRIAFGVVDKYGTPRLFAAGQVSFQIEGPAILIGDNPFQLGESGGVGAVWIKSQTGRMGKVTITVEHTSRGKKSLTIEVRQPSTKENFI